jgi:hypothetical protein
MTKRRLTYALAGLAVIAILASQTAPGRLLSGVLYDNCGQIVVGAGGYGGDPQAASCLYRDYLNGQRATLTVEAVGTDTGATNLFTVDPADQDAPIHDEITLGGDQPSVTGTATCRAMDSTASGVHVEGCTGSTIEFNGRFYPITGYTSLPCYDSDPYGGYVPGCLGLP